VLDVAFCKNLGIAVAGALLGEDVVRYAALVAVVAPRPACKRRTPARVGITRPGSQAQGE
jgi:hypothetical protein